MPELLTCPNGHEFSRDDAKGPAGGRCPVCDAEMPRRKGLWDVMGRREQEPADDAPDEPSASPKGLWSLMGKGEAKDEAESVIVDETDETSYEQPVDASSDQPPADKPRGLWSVMKDPKTVEATEEQGDADPATSTDQPKGLWSLMKSGEADDDATDDIVDDPSEDEELEVAPLEDLAADERRVVEETQVAATVLAAEAKPEPVRSRGAMKALLLGLVALPASALSLLPELWLRIPANLLGFLALMVGLLAVGEIRRSRGRQSGRKLAIGGITCGVLALMLGPFVFTQLGERWREQYGRRRTYENLRSIGDAMTGYHGRHGEYPSGKNIRRHNWQTLLLPHMGNDGAALFERIQIDRKWDADVNKAAMGTDVPAFFASGANRRKESGYSVTHFVAVGGQITRKEGGLYQVGVLDGTMRVTRDDVTDGLEQTLVAGEIVHNLPPWGEPGNFRQIGKGLTGGRDTFGNSDRTGAMFLRADGSVRFYSKNTSVEILRKLSTRNGEERVDEQHFR